MSIRTLLVDDDSTILTTLKSIFETRDFEVFTAVSAGSAVKALELSSYDLVVTDMRMETELAGFEVVRYAKSTNRRPVVVILSAFPIPSQEWREAGADAMFTKGGGIFRVLDDIERLLQTNAKLPAAR